AGWGARLRLVPGPGGAGVGDRKHAPALPRLDFRPLLERPEIEELGSPEHVPVVVELQAAPAPSRRERHLGARRRGRRLIALADGAERRVRARRAGGEATERVAQLVGIGAVGGHELEDTQARLRQRAGLVQAYDVDG